MTGGEPSDTGSAVAGPMTPRAVADRLHDDVVQALSAGLILIGTARLDRPDDEGLRDAEASVHQAALAVRTLMTELGTSADRQE